MINYSPVLTQDEKLNLTTCNNNSSDRPSDNQRHSTLIKNKIRNSRLSLSDLSLTRQTQSVVSSSSNQQRLNNLRLVGLLNRLRPSLTRKNTSNSTQQKGSEEPQPSNQTIDPESINHQSETTTVSILSSQQMTVVNLQSNLQHSSSPSLLSTNTTNPTAIRPHTPDLTNSSSELSYRLPDPPSPISAFEINLSTQSNNSQSRLNRSLYQDQRCPMYHQTKDQTVDPKPLPNHNLPQRTVTIQALPPSEHPESNRSNTPGWSQPEHLPNHQSSSKLEIEPKDEDSEEMDDDDDVLGNEELYSAQKHLSTKDEILPISGLLRENLDLVKLREIWIGAMFRPAIAHLKCLILIRLARLSKLVHQKITILNRASAKAQKSGGSKTNEMVRIIKEQALKFEEGRHWLTSKLVKLTTSNQVLERGRM
ncbi:hypothetical protein PPACK8108_LOCUS1042 [Phakopsora pachyrhizi]|uniref:Uncharacterized protein n=1 Tax=Phakopsora pachyrhizi TaxID=170000 RepID=A0AAV0AHZ7_PHAPC|nr:hypothetical protein PPACK8108_LOCUS1042 [Phakopsora pachyrhizi]